MINDILKEFSSLEQSTDGILSIILESKVCLPNLRNIVVKALTKDQDIQRVLRLCSQYRIQQRYNYSLQSSTFNQLIKEILLTLKHSQNICKQINYRIKASCQVHTDQQENYEQLDDVPLIILLRVALYELTHNLTEEIEQVISMICILEESLKVIFIKANLVFEDIVQRIKNVSSNSKASSSVSDKTERKSILSQKIEIYKRNKQLNDIDGLKDTILNDFVRENKRKRSICCLKTDFKLEKRKEKKGKNQVGCFGCCKF